VQDSTLVRPKASRQLEGITVVDVDVHVHDVPGAVAPHCEQPWRRALENIGTLAYRYNDYPGYAPGMSPFPSFPDAQGQRRHIVTSADQMRQDLDDLGVDIGILFPDCLLVHAAIRNTEYAVAVARAYNRWLVSEWLERDIGLKGAIIAPHHDPAAAAEEVRAYAGHRNVVAIYLPTSCVEPLYGNRRYDVLYDAAQETGLPVFLHSVTTVHPVFPFNLQSFETQFAAHLLAHPFSLIANLTSMIETGVPVRFPDLKIAFTEAGIGWVPWIMLRMDKEYNERRRDLPFLTEPPSYYIRRMFFATQPIEEPKHMGDMVTLLALFGGEDSVMFASDWPHHDFDHPSKVLQIPLEPEARRKILGGNALRLLNLGVPA
jgi:predicted TIM-barrel fold metal-dependent hydrolase